MFVWIRELISILAVRFNQSVDELYTCLTHDEAELFFEVQRLKEKYNRDARGSTVTVLDYWF